MKQALILSGRIAVILLAALVVVGITMSVVDTSGTNRFPQERQGEFAQSGPLVGNAQSPANGAGQPSAGQPFRGERHGPRNQSVTSRLTFGLFGMVKNFVIIGVVALVAVWGERFYRRRATRVAL